MPVQQMQQDNNGMPMPMQQMTLQQQRIALQNAQQLQQNPPLLTQQQMMNATRLMRPVMPNNNPGLRHLLQQQVIYATHLR